MGQGITSFRQTANKILVPLLWAHVPLIFFLGLQLSSDWLWPTLGAALFAGITTFCYLKFPNDLMTRLTASVAYVAIIAMVLYLMHGRDWQIDIHMYFFAGLAILSIYCDWRVIIMGAVAIACHHLILNFLFPAAIYPNGGDFLRVILHAVIVVLEAATLAWMTYKMEALLAANEQSMLSMEAASQRESELQVQQEKIRIQAESDKKEAMSRLADDFEKSVKVIVDTVSSSSKEMQTTAKSLATAAEQTSLRSVAVSSATEETSVSVQTVASSAEQLTTSIAEISGQVNQATLIINKAAEDGEAANVTMNTLSNTANKIGDVVQLIQTIAGQTNLLALNATIEAARAGEAGKGFAVVASEVKSLANQTAKATEDIEKQVSTIQAETKNAVSAINGICKILVDVKSSSTAIAAAVEQQSAATREISRNVQQASTCTQEVSGNVTGVTQVAQETGAAASIMLTSASGLAEQSESLRNEVEKFLSNVRRS